MKRILLLICIAIFTLSLSLFASCNCSGGNVSGSTDTNSDTDIPDGGVTEEVYDLERYSVLDLTANHTGEEAVVWASSNESVALVNEGIVFGVSAGSAEITATAGEAVTKYTVVVKATTAYMNLKLSQTEVELLVGKTKSISFWLTDNKGSAIPNAFVAYEATANNACVVVSEGTVTAQEAGESIISVSATCAGKTITETIKVTIKDNVEISFDKVTVEGIYTNSLNGTLSTSEQLKVYVYENDQKIETPSLTYAVSDNKVATVSETGVVTGKTAGVATVTATYVTTAGKEVSANVTVVVTCPTVPATESLQAEVFAPAASVIDVAQYASYFSNEMTTVSVTDDLNNEIPADIAEQKVTLDNASLTYGFRKLNVTINESITFAYEAEIVTKYISTADELANFAVSYGGRDKTGTYEGYYTLTNDIDMSEATIDYHSGDENISGAVRDDYGFKGIFDGKGFTIYQAKDNIFGKVSKDGLIKNTAFYSDNPLKYGAVACLFSGTLENVYIHSDLSKITAEHYSSIGYRTLGSAIFKNVVVEVVGEAEVVTSTLIYDTVAFPPTVENVYVISPSIDDPIVFKNGKVNGEVIHYALGDADKDFSALDRSCGYWQSGIDTYRFLTSNVYDLPILSTPDKATFTLENGVLTWSPVENASGYTLLLNGEEIIVTTNSYTGFEQGVVQIKANGAENVSRDSVYSGIYTHFEVPDGYVADFSDPNCTDLVSALERHSAPVVNYLAEGHTSVTDGALKIELTTSKVDGSAWAGFKLSLPKTVPNGSKLKVKLYITCDYATGVYICDSDVTRLTEDGTNKIDITAKGGWVTQTVDCSAYESLDELVFRAYTSSEGRKVTIYLAEIEIAE